ncbi:tRNA (adenosine(37)-N6)-dimethylallyltransferase MiaA [Bacillus sp. ISL-35]|uniref:tRNA (adenosine(37)-N6)-dimethylallyltransferase MiaA n=1 Tax=Bacillus sp. ISL-35 TaxID=2819122 RepID=UPI001BE580C0|nr:tRNA (adenosine(37)-N6)-dimethylallyltransferase MiaA [Bacillus sp. ISL-35]MBT2681458.1 tRNA (adenosine(37)-N6)-dimethylallyltransferase MiaA [Bacillus sp. ISL-35]MBT2701925.1 tRNA (adenosine(37)-N6)-dimethylallyltransferase MiaA [Chryseobacterium sp. ISL-80]
MEEKQKLIVLIGPTAVGKTKLSIELAKKYNGEIISGDSMQIYKGMDIGTAKISPEEMEGIRHHLIDVKDPDESFSTAEFQDMVREKIHEISGRGKMPMIVGGTGLYIQSAIYDYHFTETPSDPDFRHRLEKEAEEKGPEALHGKLEIVDPESASRVHPNNIRRVIRALEINHCTGKTAGELQANQSPELMYNNAIIGLTMERELLYNRINRRVDLMMEQGLLDEVKYFYDKGLKECQSIQAIGYKELYEYFDGKVTLSEAIENLKQNSRRYAKRQLTWFRNKMNVEWFDMSESNDAEKKFAEISKFIEGKLKIKANT